MKKYEIEISKGNWVKIPVELTKDRKAIRRTIKALEIMLKVAQGKYVESTKGLMSKMKRYFRGYILITDYIKQVKTE